ncbi:MAG: prepilin-type N-terminal cleavage/methylation domain-containing protein [Gammaproteobacteria bacterium]
MHKNGFTLIELLIAITIFAIVGLITSSVLLSSIKTSMHIETHSQSIKKLQESTITIRKDLSHIANKTLTDSKNNNIGFIGLPQDLQFIMINFYEQKKSYNVVRYTYNQKSLIRTELKGNESFSESLMYNIDHIEISYLDSKNHFQQRWITTNTLPKAILLHINSQKNGSFNLIVPIAYEYDKIIQKH